MTSSAKDFNWSSNEQTLAEFVKTATLPAVMIVTAGHHGDSEWESLSAQEVIRVHCKGSWKRVLARDSHGRGYSIPLDYPVPFKQLKPKPKDSQQLQTLLQKAKYPVEIRVAAAADVKFKTVREPWRTLDFGCLTVRSAEDIYEETFIKGNGFREGRLNDVIIVVPSYVNIRVLVSVGSRVPGLGQKLAAQAAGLNYIGAKPHMDISQFSEEKLSGGQEIYACIEPDQYITYTTLQKTMAESNPYQAISRKPPPPPAATKPKVRVDRSKDAETITHKAPKPPPARKMSAPGLMGNISQQSMIAELQQKQQRPLPPPPPHDTGVYSEVSMTSKTSAESGQPTVPTQPKKKKVPTATLR